MDDPLWIDRYAPEPDEFLQPTVRDFLEDPPENTGHLIFHGPEGVGKSAAAQAFGNQIHEDPTNDVVKLNVSDIFDRTKSELQDDPRFSRFVDRRVSKRETILSTLREEVGYTNPTGEHMTLILDNMEASRRDFQFALRRLMEQYSEATQFVLTTRQFSQLIPALQSRCIPIHVRTPEDDALRALLEDILTQEDVEYTADAVRAIVAYSDGNIREAITMAQTVASREGRVTFDAVELLRDVGFSDAIEEMLETAMTGEFTDARSQLDDLLIDEGLTAEEILDGILEVAYARDIDLEYPRVVRAVASIDESLTEATNPRIHLAQLLSELQHAPPISDDLQSY